MDFNRAERKLDLHIITTNYRITTTLPSLLGPLATRYSLQRESDLQSGRATICYLLFPKQPSNFLCLGFLICQVRITAVPKFYRQTED